MKTKVNSNKRAKLIKICKKTNIKVYNIKLTQHTMQVKTSETRLIK